MKKTYIIALAAALTLFGCSKKEPFYTAGEEDSPRILNTDIPEWDGGTPGVIASIERTAPFTFEIKVTPVDYTTITWEIDGETVAEGPSIEYFLETGEHAGKVVATTLKGKSTSRSFRILVYPAASDPVTVYSADAALVAPGSTAKISGSNLGSVAKVLAGKTELTIVNSSDTEIEFSVPSGLANGEYPVSFRYENGTEEPAYYNSGNGIYRQYTITVSSLPSVKQSAVSGKAGQDITLTGVNLQNVASLSADAVAITIVSQDFAQLVFTCPDLEAGEYALSGKDADGNDVSFAGKPAATLIVTADIVLWEGSFFVDWGTPFDDLKTQFAALKVGDTVKAYCTIADGQDYAMGCMASAWRQILTGHKDDAREDDNFSGQTSHVFEYTLNDLSIQMMNELDDDLNIKGASFVGHGYTLTRIVVEEAPAKVETSIWEGSFFVDWGTPFEQLKTEFAALKVGDIVRAYCTIAEGQDYAMGCMASDWRQILTGHKDDAREDDNFSGETSHVFEYTLNELSIQMMNELDDNLNLKGAAFVGHGYTITKITVE